MQDATEQIVKEIYLRGELVELKLKNAILRYQHIFEEGANPTWQKMPQILKNLDKTKFEEVVNTNMMPYMHISQAGKILKVNDLALDALGYQREQLLDKTLDELLIFKNTVEQTGFFEALHVNTNHFEQWLILNNYQGNGLYANTLIKTQNSEHEVFFVIP